MIILNDYTTPVEVDCFLRIHAKIIQKNSSNVVNIIMFLVGAFLKKRVDYSHGFSSVFFKDQNRPELTKIVLPKVLQNLQKTPKCTWWSKELNQKGFPRNIQYRTRPKGPPFQFFSALWDFFRIFFFVKVFPIHQYLEI